MCHKTQKLPSSGRSALANHAKGKNIKKFYQKKIIFTKKLSFPHIVMREPTNSVADGQPTLEDLIVSSDSVTAEIIWTLKSVMSGYSVRSNSDLNLTFAVMFPKVKTIFNTTRTKSMYVIKHGLAPYFKYLLKISIDRSNIFSFSFNESLNEVTQTSEMDLYVRFWDVSENKVNVHYYGSSFLSQDTHQNILSYFNDITKDFTHNRLYQIYWTALMLI